MRSMKVRKSLADRRALLASIEHSLDGEVCPIASYRELDRSEWLTLVCCKVSPGRHDVKLPSEGRKHTSYVVDTRQHASALITSLYVPGVFDRIRAQERAYSLGSGQML